MNLRGDSLAVSREQHEGVFGEFRLIPQRGRRRRCRLVARKRPEFRSAMSALLRVSTKRSHVLCIELEEEQGRKRSAALQVLEEDETSKSLMIHRLRGASTYDGARP